MFNKHFSKTTLFVAAYIVLSASFNRQLFEIIRDTIGSLAFNWLAAISIAVVALIILISQVKSCGWHLRTFATVITIVASLVYIANMQLAIERIHLIEYGLLGWLAARDLTRDKRSFTPLEAAIPTSRNLPLTGFIRAIGALSFGCFIGLIDELFQKIIPWRYFDLRDIWFNAIGAALGIILFWLNKNRRVQARLNL